MKTTHRDTYATATITDHRNGTATLVIRTINGVKTHDKTHASRKAALAAWYRFCR